ncbi:MAG: AAA family ATPase [Candidatus Methylomirabilales bacterium]
MSTTAAAQCVPKTLRPDVDALRLFWDALVRPGEVHEVRAPRSRREGPRRFFGTVSGYFDNGENFVSAVKHITGHDAEGVYLSLNPVNPALLARGANRLKANAKETTGDPDIFRRVTLYVDVDAARPSGISSTDAERDAALAIRDRIHAFLIEEAGWPTPLAITMSGNGGGLLFRLDLPNDPPSTTLIHRVLKGLACAFSTPAVTVDVSNYNAARLTKIIGTVAAKGDPVPDRPWRLATGTFCPDASPVSREALAAIAALAPPDAGRVAPQAQGGSSERTWEIRDVLTRNGITWKERAKDGYTVLGLDRCLTSPDHTDGAAILEFASNALAYKCLHNRCAGKGWADARERLGVGAPDQRLSLDAWSEPAKPDERPGSTPGEKRAPNSFPPHKGEVEKETNFCPVSATALLAEADEPMVWVWKPFLPEGTLDLMVSFMKVGKSTLVYALAVAIAQGHPFLGYPTQQGGVLILGVEEHPRDIKRRLQRFGLRPEDPVHVHRGGLDNSPGTFKALREFIAAQAIKLVILDTLPRFWSVGDENDNAEVMRQASPFLELARDTGAVVLLLHHERKSGGEEGRSIRGGSALFGLVDQALMLDRRQGGERSHRVLRTLGRYEETPPELILVLAGSEFRKLGTPEEVSQQARAETVWAVLSEIPQAVAEIAKKADTPEGETRKVLEAIGNRVIRGGGGKRGSPFTYRRAPQDSIPPQANPIGKETNSALEQVEVEPLLEEVEP